MSYEVLVDGGALREQVRKKYREVSVDPHRDYHFHTGRPLAARLGYEAAVVDALPDVAVESFAGVANPLSLRTSSRCPYKGLASYWSVKIGGKIFKDFVWSYPDPISECPKVKGLFCFFNERVEGIYVDGELLPMPKTRWAIA